MWSTAMRVLWMDFLHKDTAYLCHTPQKSDSYGPFFISLSTKTAVSFHFVKEIGLKFKWPILTAFTGNS